jgi:hypothetical protein
MQSVQAFLLSPKKIKKAYLSDQTSRHCALWLPKEELSCHHKKNASTMIYFKTAEEVLFQWVSRVCSGNADDIADLYHESAVLIPTFSPHTVMTPEGVRDYFVQLASREGLGVRLHNKALRKQSVSESLHTLSGICSFEFEVDFFVALYKHIQLHLVVRMIDLHYSPN